MRLAPLYQLDKEQAVLEGEQRLVIRQINRRFGEIDSSLIEKVHQLSIEQLEALGEALFDFAALSDLETWLNQQ
jgi:heme oxygenase